MKYVIAVSGGVDSVALLDMMVRVGGHELVVAHFDHGIRQDSSSDERFVAELAQRYGLPYETRREELGAQASEAHARRQRYRFLHEVAKRHGARIMTAHHADDLVETVAINFLRGTGWRGLAALDGAIERPLLDLPKAQLLDYARHYKLQWREDSTNQQPQYLRNRVRPRVAQLSDEAKREVRLLRHRQRDLKRAIEAEVIHLVGAGPRYSRYLFIHMPAQVAEECLRVMTDGRLTRPQIRRALLAVKTAAPGKRYHAGSGVEFGFTTRYFTL